MLKLFLISVILLAIGFLGLAIKIWAKKDGKFEGTCAGKNTTLKAMGITCGCGGEGSCKNETNNLEHNQITKIDTNTIGK